ncbi:MAG: bi-domain-containing oxidoreductase [Chloroflexi bacterium]|nr:bi-domain-containing oxidoreductase [Chloroflexota bacterium]
MVVQNYRNGKLSVRDVPAPPPHPNGLLVRTRSSLVSAGTERLITQTAKKSLIGKARARPDLVRRILQKVRTDGLKETYRTVMSRLDQTIALGYSSSGIVEEISSGVTHFEAGDRVACFGAEFASHAELASVPAALACKIPESVDFEEAAFAGVGAIALHSVNHGSVSSGQKVVVIGLGLIGTIAMQILVARGCEVHGVEPDNRRAALAKSLGAREVLSPEEAARSTALTLDQTFNNFTHAFVFASTRSNDPVETAAQMLGTRGKLVVPGMVGLDLPRHLFYEKEIELVIPRSAGPGGETAGVLENAGDSTASLLPSVRENLAEFLSLIEKQDVRVSALVTDRFPIARATGAYDALNSRSESVGILIGYSASTLKPPVLSNNSAPRATIRKSPSSVRIGFVGAGSWAKNTLLPEFSRIKEVSLSGVVTRNPANASHIAEKWNFEFAASSARELLESPELDAVVISTRHDTHASLAIQALQAGKHVFLEKPAALDAEELDRLAAEFARSQLVLYVGFNRRYAPDSEAAREFVGKHRVAISCRVNPGPVPPGHWTVEPTQGGRIIGEICHFVDLLNFIAGSRIVRVSAEAITGSSGTEESVSVSFAHENGSVSALLYGADGDRAFQRERIEIIGAGGVFVIEDFKGHTSTINGKKKRKRRMGIDRGHQKEIRSFVNSIIAPSHSTNTFDHITDAMAATFALDAAAKAHSTIEVARRAGEVARYADPLDQ